MAPIVEDDDFVGTLSDNDLVSDEEVEVPATNGTKRKRETKKQSAVKKQKKDTDENGEKVDEDVDSEFEFGLEDGITALDDYEAFVGDGSQAPKKAIDVDDIVARRRKVEDIEPVSESDGSEIDGEEDGEESEASFGGFGAGADLGENEDGVAEDEEDEASESGFVDEPGNEVAAPTPHPDDLGSEAGSDAQEDALEEEKRNAFFEPETKTPNGTAQISFTSLSLSRPVLKGLSSIGFSTPTPIQSKTIPVALEGKDVVGGAVTGSGKTAAFIIPILERLMYRPRRTATTRVAILTPTRELALQCFNVAKKLASHTDITFGQAIGGLNSREQEKQLKLRPDIVIATPGRFIDLERNSPSFAVNTVEILVLDEADRMLEEGFADELNEILSKIPKSRQTMLFSATMTSKVDDLIRAGLQRPVRVMVDAQRATVSGLVQEFVRLRPGRESKRLGYLLYLCSKVHTDRAIVFFRQKKDAHRVRIVFALCGMKAAELHGSMTQEQRIQAIESFRSGKASFLLATDLASRGLDIKGIETVINYEAPQSHEIYLHRVGRTARAGRSGKSCTLAAEPDRKIVKAAVKGAKAQGALIRQRTVDPKDADTWQTKCDSLQDEVEAVLREEKEEKALASTERQITRADNIVTHRDEILARPKKTWFESEKDKKSAKQKGAVVLNGPEVIDKEKKGKGKLSNKQKKRLLDKDDRKAGMEWKKGKSMGERAVGKVVKQKGGGAGAKPKGKPKGKPKR
ncbi:nucleolar DEAD-box protein required for synthesis of 60S ribosomal subunit [Vermiconidia calcicola]|uniref:Nucleolar DEAD-box protein required for synthesis of 60S ribosomal subunit n=1 Tax=Vermiconidia calcicola TaxID=1690605 RepID=A0ACC3MFR0_9PEZI|nr:nucleolar DEAD-box protein required for synthesis of 60S ribosomal subunit [Vermiconidia calcicola]